MQLDVNGKVYEFKFGVKFSNELDNKLPAERDGMRVFGMSLMMNVIPALQMGSIGVLSIVLKTANQTETPKITDADLTTFIEEHEDIEKLFDEVLKELENSNSGKLAMRAMKKNLKK